MEVLAHPHTTNKNQIRKGTTRACSTHGIWVSLFEKHSHKCLRQVENGVKSTEMGCGGGSGGGGSGGEGGGF